MQNSLYEKWKGYQVLIFTKWSAIKSRLIMFKHKDLLDYLLF